MKLTNKIALVTGAGKGIGRATARLLAQEGATVVVNYHSSEKAAHAVVDEIKERGGEAVAMQCDVADGDDVAAMMQKIIEDFGRIDILVNNAGILIPQPFDETTPDAWDKNMETNLRGTYNCIKAVSKPMKEQRAGKVVNVSSISSIVGSLTSAPYAASKAGVDALMKTLAPEFGPYNITINSVAPGPVETELFTSNYSKETADKLAQSTPMGRLATPEDVAKVILFFASSDSDFVTGQTLIVDGGRIIR
ncbi:beta-ketoacyl-ACP reductase [Candidatus Saccharibacteria bacterium]|nr:MAG: beta-ketoacyl-ACP reductase [Candidatus Saccharibacteria bacterium]PID99569.1 MAG: beta-ketoacyl-ACP reductase [Candidatus Saccharibacteria bacterium]